MLEINQYMKYHQSYFSFDKIKPISSCYVPAYDHTPNIEIQYNNIISYAIKRMQFLEKLECETKNDVLNYNAIRNIGIEYGFPFVRLKTNDYEVVYDQISFYSLLTIAAGFSLEQNESNHFIKKWIKKEKTLLYYRLKFSNLSVSEIDDSFWLDKELRNQIILSESNDLYKLNFEKSLQFFNVSNIELKDGFLILDTNKIYEIITYFFGKHIENLIHRLLKKNRFSPAILSLGNDYAQLTKMKKEALLTLQNFNEVFKRSFPPCMHRIFEALKKNGILTFKANFELALFLKGCGLDYESQQKFWKLGTKFQPLNLNSIYGSINYLKDYSSHSCHAMITRECPTKIFHVQGCPFRYMSKPEIKVMLKKINRKTSYKDIEDIVKECPDHPQHACKMFFDSIHPQKPMNKVEISHPVAYFVQSEKRFRSM